MKWGFRFHRIAGLDLPSLIRYRGTVGFDENSYAHMIGAVDNVRPRECPRLGIMRVGGKLARCKELFDLAHFALRGDRQALRALLEFSGNGEFQ